MALNWNDIYTGIKERLSSPLFISFIISWLIINWEITIALFWYDNEQISKTGSPNLYHFISCHFNTWDILYKPLISALIYTFLSPIVKNIINLFYAWTSKWGDSWVIKISKGGKVSMEKYLEIRTKYEERTRNLENVFSSESATKNQLINKQNELQSAQDTIIDLQNSVKNINEHSEQVKKLLNDTRDISMLNGYWIVIYKHESRNIEKEDIYIEDGNYYIINDLGEKNAKYRIMHFYYDNKRRSISFVKAKYGDSTDLKSITEYLSNDLKYQGTDTLIGRENNRSQITYRKKHD